MGDGECMLSACAVSGGVCACTAHGLIGRMRDIRYMRDICYMRYIRYVRYHMVSRARKVGSETDEAFQYAAQPSRDAARTASASAAATISAAAPVGSS